MEEIHNILEKLILELKDILKREKRLLEKLKQEGSPARIIGMLENIIIDLEDLVEDLSIANDREIRDLIFQIGGLENDRENNRE